jgi:hypothetical protein
MMMNDNDNIPHVTPGNIHQPSQALIEYLQPPKVQIVQVLKQDLVSLGQMSDEETLSSIFLGIAGGAFISCVLSLLNSGETTSARWGALVTLAVVSLLVSAYMGVKFRQQRKARQAKQQELLKSQL